VVKYGPDEPNGFSWGFQVARVDDKKIEAFKALLDEKLPVPHYTPVGKVRRTMVEFRKTAAVVLEDYMKALYHHALITIVTNHQEEYLQVLEVKYVLSLPAGWPQTATGAILEVCPPNKHSDRR
jgi:hypothetical protein